MPNIKTTQRMAVVPSTVKTKDVHFRATGDELARYCLAVGKVRPRVSGLSDLIRRLLDAECDRLGISEKR
jgi:hypothetical protein